MTYTEKRVHTAITRTANKVSVFVFLKNGEKVGSFEAVTSAGLTKAAFTINGAATKSGNAILCCDIHKIDTCYARDWAVNLAISAIIEKIADTLKAECGIDFTDIIAWAIPAMWEELFIRAGFQIIRAL